MSSFIRRSTGLARITKSTLNAYTRSTLRTTRFAPVSSAAWAARHQQLRSYSSDNNNPKQPHDGQDGEVKNSSSPGPTDAAKGHKERPPLPEGWVYLNEAEQAELIKAAKDGLKWIPKFKGTGADEFIGELSQTGVPKELQELINKKTKGTFSLKDAGKYFKSLNELSMQISKRVSERELRNQGTPGKAPGKEQGKEEEGKEQGKKSEDEEKSTGNTFFSQDAGKKKGSDSKQQTSENPLKQNDWITTIIGSLVAYWIYNSLFGGDSREITWQELRKNFLDRGLVERMVVSSNQVRVDLNVEATRAVYPDSDSVNPGFHYYFSIGSVDGFERKLEEAQRELGIPPTEMIPVSYQGASGLSTILMAFGPTLLFVGLLYWVSRRGPGGGGAGGGMFSFGKSKAKRFNHESAVKVKFSDVAGMDEAKLEIMEFVSFLQKPDKFQRLGAKIPRGAILAGPPGTGKTLLAKATAGESGVPFFSVSGSEFVEMFVGVGASRVRDLFATARKNTPCIIFIDEIDAIGRSRSGGGGKWSGGGNDEREATLNQILTEMDGFNTTEQIVVLAGTNRADVLDKALMRPGRFDRHINIDRPTMKGRQDIFKVYLKKVVTNEEIEHLSGRLAALTPGFAGADIANCVNEAALVGKLFVNAISMRLN